jgi:hypothetical protein
MSLENRVYATTDIGNWFKSNKKMPLRQIGIRNTVLNKLSLKMEFRQTVIGKHAIRVKSLWKRTPKVVILIKQVPNSATRWLHWSQIFFCKFCLQKNHEIANNSPTTEARGNNKRRYRTLKFSEIFWCTLH